MDASDNDLVRKFRSSEHAQSRPVKRQKIDVACDICKSRKSKCDGIRPVCGPCSARRGGRDASRCTYRPNESNLSSPQTRTRPGSRVQQTSTIAYPGTVSKSYTQTQHVASSESVGQEIESGSQDRLEGDDGDAMGNVESPETRKGFLGSSSGASFMRQVTQAAEGQENLPGRDEKADYAPRLPRCSTQIIRKSTAYIHFALPPKRTADHLFEVYWDYSDTIFPFLDRDEITRQYEGLWNAGEETSTNEQVFHSILNLMFALASKLDPISIADAQANTASLYYGRAMEVLSFNLLDISHFEVLQALLLATQYLQSTNMPKHCFKAIGMAVWIAQDIGLDKLETTAALESPHERELARRVWHGCILIDKIVSMTFGRPPRISRETAGVAVYPAAGVQTAGPAPLEFFIAYCKLHELLGDVLETFYRTGDSSNRLKSYRSSASQTFESIGRLFDIEQRLSSWQRDLNICFKVPTSFVDRSETGYVVRQANILHARYLYARLLLFRPYITHARPDRLSTSALSSTDTSASDSIIVKCQALCVQAAQQIIDHISSNLSTASPSSPRDVLPSPWYSIHYMYTASAVLIAAQLIHSVLDNVPITILDDYIDRAYQVLQHYESYTQSARRCRTALELLHKKVLIRIKGEDRLHKSKELTTQQESGKARQQAPFSGIPFDITAHDFDNGSLSSLAWDHDFSWLETTLFDWDSGSL